MRIYRACFVSLLSAIVLVNVPFVAYAETTRPRTLLQIDPTTSATRNSEGDIIALKNAHLALVYTRFTGGGADHDAADLAMRTSADGGRTWTDDRIVVRNEGGCNVMSVSLLRLPNDEILLFYLRKDGAGGLCNVIVRRSNDELATLSEPLRVSHIDGYHVTNNARVVRLKSGRIIVPAMLHNAFTDAPSTASIRQQAVPLVYYSDDSGATWKRDASPLEAPAKDDPILQENGLVERHDGSLLMYMRTNKGCQYACESFDDGITWSKPGPTNLSSPLSPASIERIPWSGDLLCVWNDHSGLHPFSTGKRTPLCAAVSTDDGKTWSLSRIIEPDPDGWYCYTSITFQANEAILSYCAGDKNAGGLNRLRVTALPRNWIEGLRP